MYEIQILSKHLLGMLPILLHFATMKQSGILFIKEGNYSDMKFHSPFTYVRYGKDRRDIRQTLASLDTYHTHSIEEMGIMF